MILVLVLILPSLLSLVILTPDLVIARNRKNEGNIISNTTGDVICVDNFENYVASIQYQNKQQRYLNIMTYLPYIPISTYILFLLGGLCVCWWWELNTYNQLYRKFNKYENECMPREEFARKRDFLIGTLRRSGRQDNHYLVLKGQRKLIHISSIKIKKQKRPLLTEIELEGEQLNTKWKARGCILTKNNQIFMWLVKNYENSKMIPNAHGSTRLIYESTEFDDTRQVMAGQWYCKGHRGSYLYSGTWILEESNLRNQRAEEEMIANGPAEI